MKTARRPVCQLKSLANLSFFIFGLVLALLHKGVASVLNRRRDSMGAMLLQRLQPA
jgi:hypothetical protein